MRRFGWPSGLLLLACSVACSSLFPGETKGAVQALVLASDARTSRYRLAVREITTLESLRTMSGEAVGVRGGVRVVVDPEELLQAAPATQEEVERLVRKSEGAPVDFAWFEVDGVIHPEDFTSLGLVTAYYNFERSHLYFDSLGASLYNLPLLYRPELDASAFEKPNGGTGALFWDPVAQHFVSLGTAKEGDDALPSEMNLGVVAREFALAAFSNRAFPESGLAWLYAEYFHDAAKWSRALNLHRSVGAGFADYFGGAVSGDAAFLAKSAPALLDERRLDPDMPRCLSKELAQSYENLPSAQYDPAPLGAVLSSALWESVDDTPERRKLFAATLVDAMGKVGAVFREQRHEVRLGEVLNAVAASLPPTGSARACGVLRERFGLVESDLPACAEFQPPMRGCR